MRVTRLVCLMFLLWTSTTASTPDNVNPASQEEEEEYGGLLRRRTLQGTGTLNKSGTPSDWFLERLRADFGVASPVRKSKHGKDSSAYAMKCHGKGNGGSGRNDGIGDVSGIGQGNSDQVTDVNEDCGCYDCEGDDKVCVDGHCLPCGKHTQHCCDLGAPSECEDNLVCANSGYADGKCVIECLVQTPATDRQPDCDCSTSSTVEACPPCDETAPLPILQCPPCGGLNEDCCDDFACRDNLICENAKCIPKVEQCAPVGNDCGVYLEDDSFCGCCNSTQNGQLENVTIVDGGQEIKCAMNTCCLSNIGDVGCNESNPNSCCGDLVCGKAAESNAATSNVIDPDIKFDTCCLPNGKKTCSDLRDCCGSADCSNGICCNKGFGECNANDGDNQCCGERTCIDPDEVTDSNTSDNICCALLEDGGMCDGNDEKCCGDLLCGLRNVVDKDNEIPQQDICCVPSWSPDLVTDPPGHEPKCTPGKLPLNKVLDSSLYTLEDANECCDANAFCDPHGKCVTCLGVAGRGCTSNDDACCGENLRCSHDGNKKCCVNNGRSGCNIGFGDNESLCCNSINVCDDGRCCIETGLIPPDKGRLEDRAEGCGSSDFVCCDDDAVCFDKRCCLPPRMGCNADEQCCGKESERKCKMSDDETRADPYPGTCCVKDFGRCRGAIDCCTDGSTCFDLSPMFPKFPSICISPFGPQCKMGDNMCSSDDECCGYGFVVDRETVYCDTTGSKTCKLKSVS